MRKIRVLMVEDDNDLRENIVEFLELEGFEVTGSACAVDFFYSLAISEFDITIVDIGLPDKSGFEIVQHLRENSELGIILLTARDNINDKMKGYEAGADQYFVKPVDCRELAASIKNLYLRLEREKTSKNDASAAQNDTWIFNSHNWTLESPTGKSSKLTTKEFIFLQLLISKNGNPVLRETILTALDYHNEGAYGNRALDVMIVRLRSKIKKDTQEELPVKTVHSVGYCFSAYIKQS